MKKSGKKVEKVERDKIDEDEYEKVSTDAEQDELLAELMAHKINVRDYVRHGGTKNPFSAGFLGVSTDSNQKDRKVWFDQLHANLTLLFELENQCKSLDSQLALYKKEKETIESQKTDMLRKKNIKSRKDLQQALIHDIEVKRMQTTYTTVLEEIRTKTSTYMENMSRIETLSVMSTQLENQCFTVGVWAKVDAAILKQGKKMADSQKNAEKHDLMAKQARAVPRMFQEERMVMPSSAANEFLEMMTAGLDKPEPIAQKKGQINWAVT